MTKGSAFGLALGALVLSMPVTASAGPILTPVAGVIDSGGPGFGSLDQTFNRLFDPNTLAPAYESGVTDFDAFLALNPLHTSRFYPTPESGTTGFEWFSNQFDEDDEVSAQVTFDLGSTFWINRLALWNEESAGAGIVDLSYSLDGTTFLPLALGLIPTDHVALAGDPAAGVSLDPPPSYGADVFKFNPTFTRFVRFNMSQCGLGNDDFNGCAIGEVAFAEAAPVPEPATLLFVGSGLAGLALRRRRLTGRR